MTLAPSRPSSLAAAGVAFSLIGRSVAWMSRDGVWPTKMLATRPLDSVLMNRLV
jgi:hypothetical protein